MTRSPARMLSVSVVSVLTLAVGMTPSVAGMDGGPERQRAQRAVSGTVDLLPGIAQQGKRPAASRAAKAVGTVQFKPAQKGRPVVVQAWAGTGPWKKVAAAVQDKKGVVTFSAADKAGLTYRATAKPYNGRPKVTTEPTSVAEQWVPAFADEFSGAALDEDKWEFRLVGITNDSRLKSVSSPDAVEVDGGTVRLLVKKAPGKKGRFLNGHIGTYGKFAFTYGVAAARIKFPRGEGQHGSFWMQPHAGAEDRGTPGLSGAEIDIVEYFGEQYHGGDIWTFLYNYGILDPEGTPVKIGGAAPKASRALEAKDDWWKGYHVFSVEWTPRAFIFRVDGREHWRTKRGVSKIDQYLILSLLTSDWELPRLDKSSLPQSMQVDWVRVWQNQPQR